MDRRTYLGAAAGAGLTATAGCLGGLLDSRPDGVVLGPPEEDDGDPIYPTYGEEVPSFSVEDPISGETITDEQFRGERTLVMTFIYTTCPDGVCSALLQYLNFVQKDAAENGYADDVALLAVTFDPETDTAEKLREQGEQVGVDVDADNWHFLRPESNEAAVELTEEDFGVPLEGIHERDHSDHGTNSSGEDGESMEAHYAMIFLVNERGIVERAYWDATTRADPEQVVEDVQTVVEG